MRIKLILSYDGTEYSGFQRQKNRRTVEGELESALSKLTGETISVTGASRTDAGVHALGNVCVFDTKSNIPPEKYIYAVRQYLPYDIVVRESTEVLPDFNPRREKSKKTYIYTIRNSNVDCPIGSRYRWWIRQKLDLSAMRDSSRLLVGEHDFAGFSTFDPYRASTVRTIYAIDIDKINEDIKISVTGNGFLYNMVRIITGTLVEAGRKKINSQDIATVLTTRDRTLAGPTAPPCGLMLYKIDYL